VATGRLLHTLDERALEVAFHPSGTLLASAGNGRVRLWDVTTGQCVATLLGHRDEVSSVAFSPDGTRLATGSFDQTVKVWDVATGQLLRTLAGHSQGIWGVAFSPDGLRLASAGQEQAVRIWDARPLTPALQVEREALGLLDYYLGQPMLKDQAADHIRKHKAITDEVRRQALTFLPRYRDELNSFVNAAVAVAQKPDATAKEYQAALGHALTAIQLNPGDDAFRTAFVLGTLGMAQYRCGQLPQALITLTQGRNVLLGDDSPRILADVGKLLMSPWALPVACNYQRCFFPPHLAFLAMAQHRSGQREAAQESLAVLRFLAQEPAWNSDPLVHQFLHEAETVIGVSHPPAQP
jgi:hypothetical protein